MHPSINQKPRVPLHKLLFKLNSSQVSDDSYLQWYRLPENGLAFRVWCSFLVNFLFSFVAFLKYFVGGNFVVQCVFFAVFC